MNGDSPQFDVLIVGGGLAGLSLAAALRETSLRLALIETRPPQRPEGWDARVYAVSPANAAFLASIGAWKHLDPARMAPIHAMDVRGDAGAHLEFSAYETGVDELGWIVESSQMACELWEGVRRQGNLTLFCPAATSALSFSDAAVTLTLQDGRVLTSRLVVAADGRDSWVRRSAGLAAFDAHYNEMGVVANFACARPHRNIARQWFRDDGILAWLPLPGERISIVWSTPDAQARELLMLDADALCQRVAAAGAHELGRLSLLTPPAAFPLRLMRVPEVVAPRLALIGDAAHGIHPLSGHGINLGFQDARVLAAELAQTPVWQDFGSLHRLRRYQRARREEVVLMQTATDSLHQLFRARWPGVRTLRNLGMNLTNGLPVIKNTLVRYALGTI